MRCDELEKKPNSLIIEQAAISNLKQVLLQTNLVDPGGIQENDRTPSWDGELRIYNQEGSFSKDTLVGRIPVQVKGTYVKKYRKKPSFSVSVDDLKNYQEDRGVMFFVIYVKGIRDCQIFYRSLLPFDLRRILDNIGKRKTKSIKLDPFPQNDGNAIVRLLLKFIQNRKKQSTLLPNLKSLFDLEGSTIDIERLEIPSISGTRDISELFDGPQYVYIKPKNIETSFVAERIIVEQITRRDYLPIIVGGELLYDHVDMIVNSDETRHFKIGSAITFRVENGNLNFNLSFNGTLHEQIRALKLITALLHGKEISVGGNPFVASITSFGGHTVEEAEQILGDLETIDNVLSELGVKKDLQYGSLTDKELNKLSYLISGIRNHAAIPFNDIEGNAAYGRLVIGNITLMIMAKKETDNAGFIISNFFDEGIEVRTKGTAPESEHVVSAYVLLQPEWLEEIDNIDFTRIGQSVIQFPFSGFYEERVTYLALELLKYFDLNPESVILDAVIELLDYLQEHDDSEMTRINRIQTEKRRRELNEDEITYLVSMKSSDNSLEYQLAACILLESNIEAQMIYRKMREEERELFEQYPIMNLWKRN